MIKFIAHRGLSSQAFENTIKSFTLAAQSDFFWGIETDIWLTKDNKFVCCHEQTPFIAPHNNLRINESNYDEIKTYKLSNQFSKYRFDNIETIPLLNNYLKICNKFKKHPVIEIKQNNLSLNNLQQLITLVKKYISLSKCMFISFNHNICEMLKQINRNTNIAYLIWHEKKINFLFPSLLKKKIKSHINSKHNIDIEYRLLNKWIVKQFHSNALKVNVWTIDKEKQIRKLIKWGVDFITTNKCFNM